MFTRERSSKHRQIPSNALDLHVLADVARDAQHGLRALRGARRSSRPSRS